VNTQPLIETRVPQTKTATPWRVWLGLFIAVALDAPVQLIWKALMIKYGDPSRGPHGEWLHQARWLFLQLRTWGLLALFLCQFLNWMWVLSNADLSFAQPFTALSYVVISTCAVIFFHEHLSLMRIVGIAIIFVGVILVGSSEHKTTDPIDPGVSTSSENGQPSSTGEFE
jgi:drug/metabolite transporter (DMT)-like permease